MHRQWLTKSLAFAAILGLLAAGCGDDDEASDDTGEDSATTADAASSGADPEPDLAAYCDAELALELAGPPDVDFDTASPEEMSAALSTYASGTIQPLAEDLVAVVPDEVAAEVDTLRGAVEEMASTGDPSIWESPEVSAAGETLHQFDLDNCGWNTQQVTATEYSYNGIPAELPAGVTSFELSNEGDELHELLLLRKNDGVTASAEDLLALPEEEAMAQVTELGEAAFAPPGDHEYTVLDLEPGNYIAVCFIPVGATSEDGPPPEGPPHAMHGMVVEFSVS